MRQHVLPIILTIITCIGLITLLYFLVLGLNLLPFHTKIIPQFLFSGIIVGLTIYLKTSIDFAIFIGNLMKKNPGWQNRIAIEIGTALGNSLGTFSILLIWIFFKEVPILMIAMILLASLVLLKMAEEGLSEINIKISILHVINSLSSPLINHILPSSPSSTYAKKTFVSLFLFAFTIPFILGLDDFAGYIPLFNIINVVSFATGVFVGHMLLNIFLFASPKLTIATVRQPMIILIGSLAFIVISFWGFLDIFKIIFL